MELDKKKRNIVLVILSMIAGIAYLTPLIRFSFYDQMIVALNINDVQLGPSPEFTGSSMLSAMCRVVFWQKSSIRRNC